MAQAALQEEFTFPAGGIADFYKDDEELAAMDREDAQRAFGNCLLYTSPSPRDGLLSRMPSSA